MDSEERSNVSMYSETNSESTHGEFGALVELMEEQIYDQNIQIQELKKTNRISKEYIN